MITNVLPPFLWFTVYSLNVTDTENRNYTRRAAVLIICSVHVIRAQLELQVLKVG